MLHSVAVRREVELTPKAKILYKTAVHFKRQATRTSKKYLSFKQRLEAAERCAHSPLFTETRMTSTAKKFFQMQVRETKNKPKGRNFTDQEKILCLTLFKNSPKSYDLLQRMFTLPCKKTLKMYLARMSLKCGINQELLDVLKKRISKLEAADRYCTVMFDEISLQAHVDYNQKLDQFEGFVDTGEHRTTDLADHALVFMARGIRRTWKQPIAFSFCQASTKGAELVQQLRTVLESLFNIGLRPIATVCDQATANVSAVNTLLRNTEERYRRRSIEWRGGFFKVNNKKIFPLYDMPHLLKGIRNNLLRRDISFVTNGERLLAKWQHLVDLYEFDKERVTANDLRLLPTLSEAHVHPSHTQKMKVKYCSQVFSQRVAVTLRYVAEQPSSPVAPEAEETAQLLQFFDRLFDSVNSSSFNVPEGKPLKAPLRDGSAHVGFWDGAMEVLCTMEFIDPVSKRVVSRPPSLTNWIATIRGLQLIWRNLQACGFKFLFLRNLNQDPLENFFGSIRSHGSRNINPSCTAFIAAFKTLTVNNFTARKFIGANCEVDITEGALSTLGELLTQPKQLVALPEDAAVSFECDQPDINEDEIATNTSFYCCGWVLTKIRPIVKDCTHCKSELFAGKGRQHRLIEAREYDTTKSKLNYASYNCATAFVTTKKITKMLLPKYCATSNVCKLIKKYVKKNVDFNFLTCSQHKIKIRDIFVGKTIQLILFGWVREVNKILTGREIIQGSSDTIKEKAKLKFEKSRKYKKFMK